MRNKQGILMPETLKIIIAVIGIALLVYLAVSLYGIFIKDSEIEQAEASLEIMHSKIKSVESGEEDNLEFLIESPNDWWIIVWPTEELEKPLKCVKDYCICICPDNSLKGCDDKGVCKDLAIQIALFNENALPVVLKIEKPISLNAFLLEPGIVAFKVNKEDGGDFGGGGASGEW